MTEVNFDRVSAWISGTDSGLEAPLAYQLIAGGRSNLTYKVTSVNGKVAVMRRPPTSHVLPTAHDMRREFRIISALHDTVVPVARPIALCEDLEIAELPFYLMSYVEGHILKETEEVERAFDKESRGNISASLVRVLSDLHSLDVEEIGLGTLAKKDSYIERQLKRWYEQYRKSSQEINTFSPQVDKVHELLSGSVPPQQRTSVVHGDYRLDNALISDSGEVAAVLDWEICTLGDPMADLGLLVVYWADRDEERSALGRATSLDGFWSREQIADQYAKTTGADISNLGFYVAFAYWKLACILQGVYSRYLQGATGGDLSDVSGYGEQVTWLASQALKALGDQ